MEPARRVVSGKHAAARNVSGSGSHSQYLAHLKLGVLHCVSRMEDRDTAHSAVRELQALLRGVLRTAHCDTRLFEKGNDHLKNLIDNTINQ